MTLLFALLAIVAGLDAIWLQIHYDRAMTGWRKAQDGWRGACDLLKEMRDYDAEWIRKAYSLGFQVGWQRPKSVEEADRLATELWEAAQAGEEKTH